MIDKILDIIGELCWILMYAGPVVIVILMFRYFDGSTPLKIGVSLVLSFFLVAFLYVVRLVILFRHGFGPG